MKKPNRIREMKTHTFNPEIYNWRRIRLAPALILIGFGVEVYAILLDTRKKK